MADTLQPSPFPNLPLEIVRRILEFSLPVQHLRVQQFVDPSWTQPKGPKGIPSLFFVNKIISEEAAAIFYSRAVLNVAPLRPPAYLFDTLTTSGPRLDLAFGLDVAFSFCPRRHLKRLSTAKIYSGQSDAINAEAYEALLRWLIDSTAVRTIYLSQRLMTRLRKARTDFDSTLDLCTSAPRLSLIRTIYVYREHPRSQWESTRIVELKRALKGRELPRLQSYVLEEGGGQDALLDPRWDVRKSDEEHRLTTMDRITAWLDPFLGADSLAQTPDDHVPEDTKYDLYQLCFVFKGPHSNDC